MANVFFRKIRNDLIIYLKKSGIELNLSEISCLFHILNNCNNKNYSVKLSKKDFSIIGNISEKTSSNILNSLQSKRLIHLGKRHIIKIINPERFFYDEDKKMITIDMINSSSKIPNEEDNKQEYQKQEEKVEEVKEAHEEEKVSIKLGSVSSEFSDFFDRHKGGLYDHLEDDKDILDIFNNVSYIENNN